MSEKEVWVPVEGFEGCYEISNLGRLKSMPRLRRNRYGICCPVGGANGKVIPGTSNKSSYVWFRLYGTDKARDVSAHCLVLESFVGPCPKGMQGCHNDGNPRNNCLDNLRWDTPKNNQKDRERHGRTRRGHESGRAKLTEEDIPIIRHLKGGKRSMHKVGKLFGVDVATIRDIWIGRTWRHVK